MSTTIEEAIAWLYKATGETWTPRELLARILWAGHERRTHNGRFGLPIKAAPPIDTKFGAYRLGRENGTAANLFIRQFGMPWQTIPLWPPQIEQLFHCGETTACVAEQPEDNHGQADRYILVEPLNQSVRITLSMVRIPDDVLRVIAMTSNAITRTDDYGPSSAEVRSSTPATDPSNVPPASVEGGSEKQNESREERDRRIAACHAELKKNVHNPNKMLATQEKLSVSMIKRIVKRERDKQNGQVHGPNTTFPVPGRRHTRT